MSEPVPNPGSDLIAISPSVTRQAGADIVRDATAEVNTLAQQWNQMRVLSAFLPACLANDIEDLTQIVQSHVNGVFTVRLATGQMLAQATDLMEFQDQVTASQFNFYDESIDRFY